MRRRLRSNNTNILKLAMIGVVAMAGGFLLTSFLGSKSETQALSATEFQAGRIIDDSIFYNPNTMTAAEIDAFIDSHSPTCDMWGTQKVNNSTTRAEYVKQLRAQGYTKYHDPPFVCVSEYYENPETHKTNFETGGKKEAGMLSAGEIIYKAAHEYNINPQVLLVMLKKESYVWGDDWPHSFQYNTVMGYACPDGAPCDSKYFGFYNQVMMAAWQLNYYREHIYSYNYRPYTTNQILYNPDRSCGSKSVYLENIATTSLYIYTPYVPNDGALANYPGTSYCGSYGNRNFYMYFREWFGNTLGVSLTKADIFPEEYYLANTNNNLQIAASKGSSNLLQFKDRASNSFSTFEIQKNPDGSYRITQTGTSLLLTARNVSPSQSITLENNNNSSSQKWYVLDYADGSYAIAPYDNKSLVITQASNSALSLAYINAFDSFQHFTFIQPNAPVGDGLYEIQSSINPEYVIDIAGGKQSTLGTNIQLYKANNTLAQRYNISFNPQSGSYIIESRNKNYALDVASNSNVSGANVQLYSLNKTPAQQWEIHTNTNGTVTFIGRGSGKALDLSSAKATSGSNIQIYASNHTPAQQWRLSKIVESETILPDGDYNLAASNTDTSKLSVSIKLNIYTGFYNIYDEATKTYLADNSKIAFSSTDRYAKESSWTVTKVADNEVSIRNQKTGAFLTVSSSATKASFASSTPEATLFLVESDTNDEQNTIPGKYEILSSKNSNFAIDLASNSPNIGANIQLYIRNKTPAQTYTIQYNEETDDYTIYTNNMKALDVVAQGKVNGTNIWQYAANNTCAQRWKIQKNNDETYSFFSSCAPTMALDLSGAKAENGANVQLYVDNGTPAQKWLLIKK